MIPFTFLIVLSGTLLLGGLAGLVGCLSLLRGQSLLADAIAHATLPGIAFTFIITQSVNPYILLLGGGLSGALAVFLVQQGKQFTKLKNDALLAIVLSTFFGSGLVLITYIQKKAFAHQSILNKFLFGNAALLLAQDVKQIAFVTLLVVVTIFLFWKEFKVFIFDKEYAYTVGYATKYIELLLTLLLLLVIATGLQIVGVMLMSSMLIAPAAAARQWTNSVSKMILFAALFGAVIAASGVWVSSLYERLPTGPVIVVISTVWVVLSLLFASSRGLMWRLIR